MKNIREPYVAGMFYPRSKYELEYNVDHLLDNYYDEQKFENVKGIVAPHAGYLYSGKTAAYAFNSFGKNQFETAIIISPSHKEYFPGTAIYDGDAFKTPLGLVPINKEKAKLISEGKKTIFFGEMGHLREHGIEVEIPFLQRINLDFSIVPIVMGDQSDLYVDELVEGIKAGLDEKTIVIASSDLSHFYPRPQAEKLDSRVEEHINNFSFIDLQNDLNTNKCEACGGGPILAMMKSLNHFGIRNSKVLYRTDSGEITRDFSEVVGYLSAAVYN